MWTIAPEKAPKQVTLSDKPTLHQSTPTNLKPTDYKMPQDRNSFQTLWETR